MKHYNDENIFILKGSVDESLKDSYVSIPIKYRTDENGTTIFIEDMMEEFGRTLGGIEITVDFFEEGNI